MTVAFSFAQFSPGYTFYFAEDELCRVTTPQPLSAAKNFTEGAATPRPEVAIAVDAAAVLEGFDLAHRSAARKGFEGLEGAPAANAFAQAQSPLERRKLRRAVQVVCLLCASLNVIATNN